MADQSKMENTKYGKRREGRWTPIRGKAQDTRANPNSWGIHLVTVVRKRWDIGLLRALSLRIMMIMMTPFDKSSGNVCHALLSCSPLSIKSNSEVSTLLLLRDISFKLRAVDLFSNTSLL